ncbi:MAG TPA: hypothetical protein DEP45_10795 [Armatimonadetes bacterium]|nr:hypothetical protein [Armatimonadota bacterium]
MTDRPGVVVIGAGGHGRVMVDVVRCQGKAEVVGFLDDAADLQGTISPIGVPIIGRTGPEDIAGCGAVAFVVAIGSNRIRAMLFDRCLSAGLTPWPAVHPSAVIAESATLGGGTQVVAQAVVNPGARVGRNVILNTACTVDHDCIVADHAFLAPGVNLGGEVTVGESAFVGIGASVLPGITIGAGATVGGGAVVISDVPPGATVVGVPAKTIKFRE